MERDRNSDAGKLGRRTVTMMSKKNKKKGQGKGGNFCGVKKGFSDEQIRLLESMFETETKPEPRKKVELARELGLQPRQVAIWFQNRRARWKSKQLEQEYLVLKCNYDKLLVDFDSLKKEHQSLRSEFRRLSCMLGRACDGNDPGDDNDSGSGHEGKFIGRRECFDGKWIQDEMPCKVENSVDGNETLNMAGDEDDGRSTTAGVPEKWCNFGFGDLSDYSCSNSNNNTPWWNFCI